MSNPKLEEGLELDLQFHKYAGGLVPIVVQDMVSKDVLMVAGTDETALKLTIEKGYVTFWSRSQVKYWTKGETSGNRLIIREIRVDCDQDALVYLVEKEKGGACHTNDQNGEARNSCFYRRLTPEGRLEHIEGMQ